LNAEDKALIELRNVTAMQKGKATAENIQLKLNNGSVYGICASEEQLTLLTDLFAGALTPVDGTVLINGFDMTKEAKRAKEFIGFMPSQSFLPSCMTPLEYLLFVADIKGLEYRKTVRRISDVLDFTYLSSKRNTLIKQLSVYEQRCLSLSQAIIGRGEILILNMPYKGLTLSEADRLTALLEEAFEERTVILGDTDAQSLRSLCDTVYAFDGQAFSLMEEKGSDPTNRKEER